MKINPTTWAKKLVANHGPDKAHDIVTDCGKPRIGKDGDEPNPHFIFYREAYQYLKKHHPQTEKAHAE